jgi:hypothetical protein
MALNEELPARKDTCICDTSRFLMHPEIRSPYVLFEVEKSGM